MNKRLFLITVRCLLVTYRLVRCVLVTYRLVRCLLVTHRLVRCLLVTVQAGKVYSKHWSLREEALIEIRKAMSELDESASKDEALLLMRGALVAINRSIKDNVFAVSKFLNTR